MIKALVPPHLEFEENQEVRVDLDPSRLHVFDEAGDALLSAGGEPIFRVTPAD